MVPPSHRFDLQSEVDLVEEIARLTGYDSVPRHRAGDRGGWPGCRADARRRAAAAGAAAGRRFRRDGDARRWSPPRTIAISRACRSWRDERSGLPIRSRSRARSCAGACSRAWCVRSKRTGVREPGTWPASPWAASSRERTTAITRSRRSRCCCAGTWPPATIGAAPRACDFADLKGALELVFAELHLDAVRWERVGAEASYLHPGKAARIEVGGVLCGYAGALHPEPRRLATPRRRALGGRT